MTTSPRVFVVTGANKGIGNSIVKLLLQDKEEKIVYLTSRNVENGQKAVKDLEGLNLKPVFHQLDITDRKSIEALRDHLLEKHGGLDVLVNNAGMAYKFASTAPFSEQALVTVTCNFFGTLAVCDILFPHLKPNARVVHVSSGASVSAYKKLSKEKQATFAGTNLTVNGLKDLLNKFIADSQDDLVEKEGWPQHAYGMSKVGESIMTILQQKQLDKNPENGIIVNACCPGYVATDMAGRNHPNMKTPDEGADTPVYLALLSVNAKDPRGCFVRNRAAETYPPC